MGRLSVEEKLRYVLPKIQYSSNVNLMTLQLDLTDHCVCRCRGCEHWKWPTKTVLDKNAIFNNIIPFLDTNTTIVFSGGEPLLHPDVEEITTVLHQHGHHLGIITSGLGRNDLSWSTISKNCDWVRFSIDGFTNENYALTRGVNLLDKWTKNLKMILKENENSLCKTRLNVTIHEYNLDSFTDNLINFLSENKLNIDIFFWLSRELISKLRQKNKVLDDKITDELQILLKNMFGYRAEINTENVLKHLTNKNNISYHSCFVPQLFGLVACDGNVFPCCYMYEPVFTMDKQQTQFVIGNINEENLHEIYTGNRYYDIVNKFRECDKKFPQCEFCDRFDHINKYLNEIKYSAGKSVFI
ncbi:MAG: SPASM domain-containing protein [Nitrosarchaeum sp.]|nr:SPASM domain-containing protein [Nitrosarchaeum sp.]